MNVELWTLSFQPWAQNGFFRSKNVLTSPKSMALRMSLAPNHPFRPIRAPVISILQSLFFMGIRINGNFDPVLFSIFAQSPINVQSIGMGVELNGHPWSTDLPRQWSVSYQWHKALWPKEAGRGMGQNGCIRVSYGFNHSLSHFFPGYNWSRPVVTNSAVYRANASPIPPIFLKRHSRTSAPTSSSKTRIVLAALE